MQPLEKDESGDESSIPLHFQIIKSLFKPDEFIKHLEANFPRKI